MIKWQRQYRLIPGNDDDLPMINWGQDDDLPMIAPSKKKGTGSLGVGAMSAVSGLSSISKDTPKADTEGLMKGIRYTEVEPEVKVEKPVSTIADPVGDIINPLEEKFNESLKNYKQFGGEGRAVSESTGQKPLVSKLPPQKTIKEVSKAEFDKASGDFEEGLRSVEENLFPSGIVAGNYVKQMVQEHGVDEIKDNKTVQLAFDKFQRYERLKEMVKAEPNLLQLSVDLERMNDKNFDKQILQLEGGDENDRGLDNYMNVLPQSVIGEKLNRLIHSKDIQTLATEDENVKRQLDELKDGGIYRLLPEYGEIVARNILSREYQQRRANKIINPIFDKSTYLDNLSDEVFKDNPALKEIADTRLKGNWEGKIDTPGLVDEFGTGARRTFSQMGESFKDFIGAGKTEKERITEGLKQEYEGVHSGVSGAWQKLGQAANFGGMLVAMAATGSPARVLASPKAAHIAITGLTFYDEEKTRATMKFPGEPGKANLEAFAMTTLYTIGLRNGLPAKQLTNVLTKARPEISKTIKSLSADAVESEIKNGMSNALQKAVKGTFTGAGEMVALTTINQSLDKALGLDAETFSKYHPDNELLEVAESMIIGLAAPQLISNIGSRRAVSNSLYNMAEFPQRYKDILSQQPITADIQKRLDNIDFLSSQKKLLDERGVEEPNQKRFLLEALNEKYINEQLEGGKKEPKGAITREAKEQLKDHQEIQERILKGEDAETIVTEREQKAIDEKEEARIELERLTKDNELANEKLDAQRKGLDGRNPEDRLKIKEIEEKRKRENEDYEREKEKLSIEEDKISEPIELNPELPEGYQLPDQQKIDFETNIPEIKTEKDAVQKQVSDEMDVRKQAEHGKGVGEGDIQPEIPTGKEEGKGTGEETGLPKITSKSPLVHVEYPPTSLSYMGTGKLETEFDIAAREPTQRKSDLYTIREADDLLEKGWDVQKELNKIDSGEKTFVADAEYINFTRYAAELSDRLRNIKDTKSADYDRTLKELSRVANAANLVGKDTARALGIRGRFSTVAEDSYGEFMLTELAANKDAPLTDRQKETANAEFDRLDTARKKLDEDTKAFEEKVASFKAERELGQTTKSVSKGKKRTHEDYVSERKSLKEELAAARKEHEDWLKEQGIQKAGFGSLTVKEAKVIAKIVKSYAAEGVTKLKEVVEKVLEEVKGIIPNLNESDIHDVIRGAYNEKKITKREATIRMENLRIEAQLLDKYEKLIKGEEPKNEKAKIKRNQEIEELRKKIEGLKKEEKEFEKFYGESNVPELKIEKLQDELDRIQSRRQKEKPEKGAKEEIEMSDREKEIRSEIEKEQANWDAELDAAKLAKKEYRKLETERNRQIAKVADLKQKLNTISGGNLPERQKREIKVDTPEIDALKEEIKTAEKFIRSAKAAQERIRKMEVELQRLKDREEKEPKQVNKRQLSDKEKQLKEDIINERKSFEKEKREAGQFYREQIDPDVRKLQSIQKRNETETAKIKELIAKGDFSMPEKKTPLMEDKEIQKKFPEQFKATQKSLDTYIKAKREISLRRLRQMYENKSPEEKTIEIFSKSLNIPRTIMASFDFSAPLRQAIIATAAHPQIASKALKFMFEAAKDEKVYNRWLEDVHNSPRWHIAEKTGLGITDPASLHVKFAEEAFQGAPYAEKIPIVGLGVKASERAYIGFLNKLRWDLFNMYADRFEDTGKTYENNPKLYEGISSFVNSETGRGGMKGLENAAPVFNWVLFASKLIASRLNMLGLSDIPNLVVRGTTLGKYGLDYGFYNRLPKELRIEAAKDMAKFLAIGMSTLVLANQLGADTESDPRSSDFGKIKVGNTRWDIWGGFQPYARVLTQVLSGQRKTTTTGEIQELDKKSFMGQTRFTPLWNFARGKLAPIPATIIDLASHKDAAGQPVTAGSELLSLVTPLMIRDTYEAMQDQGVKALFTVGVPAAFGVGVQTYEPKKPKDSSKQTKSTNKKQTKQTKND